MLDDIQGITFDLWQTLIIDNRELGRSRANRRIEETITSLGFVGHNFSYEHVQDAYRLCYRMCREVHKAEKDYSFDHQVAIFINNIAENLFDELDKSIIEQINYWYGEAFFEFPPKLDPESESVLRNLSSKGYKIGLISNTGMTSGTLFRRYLKNHNILDFFQVLTFSDEVLLCKPSSEIFHMTLKELDCSPDVSIHVGDHILNDVYGAHRAGLQSVLLGNGDGQEKIDEADFQINRLSDLGQLLC
jgi:putative hydrolase of the HAD superfamily